MTSRFPWGATVLAGVASASLVTLWLLPSTPYHRPLLHPWALGLSGVWTLGCALVWERHYGRWRDWRASPTWIVSPPKLASRTGVVLGKGFRWQAPHVEQLERALLTDGGLPEGLGRRGGYPALHAVGMDEETLVQMSWEDLTTHLGLFGTTGSGKSRALEAMLAQAIGGL